MLATVNLNLLAQNLASDIARVEAHLIRLRAQLDLVAALRAEAESADVPAAAADPDTADATEPAGK